MMFRTNASRIATYVVNNSSAVDDCLVITNNYYTVEILNKSILGRFRFYVVRYPWVYTHMVI